MPYVYEYERILKENNQPYDLVCFDRRCTKPITKEKNVYTFYHELGTDRKKKIIPYLQYAQFVKSLIKKNKYDKLIILTTVPAVMLYHVLIHQYKGRYIFDYRDYTFEKIKFYKNAVNTIVLKSYASFLSSEGFYSFVNRSKKTHIVHNITNAEKAVEHRSSVHDPITIGFVGLVRYFDVNTKLIEAFKNNDKYRLMYTGTIYDDCDLPQYCENNNISNVVFTGEFQNTEKPEIYKSIDLINSVYSLKSKEVSRAIPNRLYDAALYKIPLLVAKGSFLSEVVENYHLGLSIDIGITAEEIFKKVDEYFANLDRDKFEENCNVFLMHVQKDQEYFNNKVRKFITNKNE